MKKLLNEVEAGLLRPNSDIYIYRERERETDLYITLLVMFSLRFAASEVHWSNTATDETKKQARVSCIGKY